MGLYNYLGNEGEQVKCFYVPCIHVKRDPKTGMANAEFYTSGGLLNSYTKEVPYRTYYYNYGKDFLILDYVCIYDEPFVHIIQNGEYVDTVNYQKVPQNTIFDIVIDNYGRRLNIQSLEELTQFIAEYNQSKELEQELEKKYFAEANMSIKIPSVEYFKDMSQDEMYKYFNRRSAIYDEIYKVANKPFVDQWLLPEEPEVSIIGLLLSDYEKKRQEDNEFLDAYEYEWHVAFPAVVQHLKKLGIENPIEAYLEWAKHNKIEIDKNYIYQLFEKYSQPCSKELEERWLNSPFGKW